MIDLMQWIAIGLTGVLVLLAHRLLGKHERVIREMAKTLKVARALRRPLVYCPSHGGQESDDNGRCVKCR